MEHNLQYSLYRFSGIENVQDIGYMYEEKYKKKVVEIVYISYLYVYTSNIINWQVYFVKKGR